MEECGGPKAEMHWGVVNWPIVALCTDKAGSKWIFVSSIVDPVHFDAQLASLNP